MNNFHCQTTSYYPEIFLKLELQSNEFKMNYTYVGKNHQHSHSATKPATDTSQEISHSVRRQNHLGRKPNYESVV